MAPGATAPEVLEMPEAKGRAEKSPALLEAAAKTTKSLWRNISTKNTLTEGDAKGFKRYD